MMCSLIQDLLVPLDLPVGVDDLIALAIRKDNRLRQLRRHRGGNTSTAEGALLSPTPSPPALHHSSPDPSHHLPTEGEGEPMQLGRARLTEEERRRRQLEGRCFYCGEMGHLVITYPTK